MDLSFLIEIPRRCGRTLESSPAGPSGYPTFAVERGRYPDHRSRLALHRKAPEAVTYCAVEPRILTTRCGR